MRAIQNIFKYTQIQNFFPAVGKSRRGWSGMQRTSEGETLPDKIVSPGMSWQGHHASQGEGGGGGRARSVWQGNKKQEREEKRRGARRRGMEENRRTKHRRRKGGGG